MSKETKNETHDSTSTSARPLQYVKDKDGVGWLCDMDIDVTGDLKKQGCWRCDEMAFPMGGR